MGGEVNLLPYLEKEMVFDHEMGFEHEDDAGFDDNSNADMGSMGMFCRRNFLCCGELCDVEPK